MKRILAIFILLLTISCNVFAASYYIDFDAGDDTSSGISTETPWKHAPWDSNATNTAAAATINPGDGLNFQGGVQYGIGERTANGTMLAIDDAGAADNKIIIQSYGTGKAIFHSGIALDETQFSLVSGSTYSATKASLGISGITIQGVYEYANRNNTDVWIGTYHVEGSSTLPSGCTYYDNGTNLYIRTSDNSTPTQIDHKLYVIISDFGFYSTSTTNVGYKFKDLIICGFAQYGIRVLASSANHNGYGVEVDSCEIHYCAGTDPIGMSAISIGTSAWIHDTSIVNNRYGAYGSGITVGTSNDTGSLVEDNSFRHFGRSGISINGTGGDHIIRRNFLMGQETDTASQFEAMHHIFKSGGSAIGDAYYYRNVIFNVGSDCAFFDGNIVHGTVYMWNNTAYEDRSGYFGNTFFNFNYSNHNTCTSGAPVIVSRNNLVVRRGHVQSIQPECSSSVLEYNYYISDGSNQVFSLSGGGYRYLNSENGSPYFRDDYSQYEGNSVQVIDDDINLMDYFESITYGDANFLHPKVGSPTIDAGTTISDGENETDHDGNTVTGTYDIGAYEYGSEESSTTKQSISGYFNIN